MTRENKGDEIMIAEFMGAKTIERDEGRIVCDFPKRSGLDWWLDYDTSKGKIYDDWWFKTSLITTENGERAKIRSKTFPGIAEAMANQWSDYLKEKIINKC